MGNVITTLSLWSASGTLSYGCSQQELPPQFSWEILEISLFGGVVVRYLVLNEFQRTLT